MNIYVPLYVIRNELLSHYERYQKCCSIPSVCQKILHKPELHVTKYYNPFPPTIEALDDNEFMECFFNTLYPLERTLSAIKKNDAHSYLSESLFSKSRLFFVFLHENFALQTFHEHDFFEIVYVYKGYCTLNFKTTTINMTEGNVCIIAPHTFHEPFVLDKDSFVINLSMTAAAFESAFSTVLLRRDLVAAYIQTILYKKDMPNYLFIPSNNSDGMKNAVRHIAYENRNDNYYSFSFCISWLSVFICSTLNNYQSDIQIYNDNKKSSQAERLLLLEYIQNNFRTATLDSVAKYFNYNKSYLSRLIIQLTGETFVDIITKLKLKAGRDLLEDTDFSLEQISEIIGYNSGDYFSKVFKKVYHISAAEYRHNISISKNEV